LCSERCLQYYSEELRICVCPDKNRVPGLMATPKDVLLGEDASAKAELLLNLLNDATAGRDVTAVVSEVIQVSLFAHGAATAVYGCHALSPEAYLAVVNVMKSPQGVKTSGNCHSVFLIWQGGMQWAVRSLIVVSNTCRSPSLVGWPMYTSNGWRMTCARQCRCPIQTARSFAMASRSVSAPGNVLRGLHATCAAQGPCMRLHAGRRATSSRVSSSFRCWGCPSYLTCRPAT
jgi:hypothetical protein